MAAITPARRGRAQRLREDGMSHEQICKKLRMGRTEVADAIRDVLVYRNCKLCGEEFECSTDMRMKYCSKAHRNKAERIRNGR